MESLGPLRIRRYGSSGPVVIVLHGGPAAIGSAGPVARGLADAFRVIEPWQRGSGQEPLSVARHVADLHEIVESCGAARPAIIGESWGAMLALAYAAAHPNRAGPLALVGCGTFDKAARARMRELIEERTTADLRQRMADVDAAEPDPGERMRRKHEVADSIYTFAAAAPEPDAGPAEPFDLKAHTETWNDMLREQEAGRYPAAFAAIRSPVLMLHGTYDPHPGPMIRAGLAPYLPELEYRELDRCGHSPWAERFAREEFFAVLREWLARQATL